MEMSDLTREILPSCRACCLATTLLLVPTLTATTLAQSTPQPSPTASPQRIAERDRLFADVQRLEDEGRLEDAVALLVRAEAIEVELGLEYDRAGSASYLARLYERLGEHEEASGRLGMSLSILERLAKQEDANEARWRLVDVKWQRENLNLRRTLKPEDLARLDEATALGSETTRFWRAGRYEEALSVVRRALELQRSVYPPEHPAIAKRLHELGLLYRESGDYYAAQKAWAEALDLRRRTLGPAHPLYGESLFNLGEISELMGRYDEAEALLREAHTVLETTRPAGHPDPVRAIVSLGSLLRKKGDLLMAEELLLEARKRAKANDELYREALSALALLNHDLGDLKSANALMTELDEATRKAVGESHVEYSNVLQNRAALASAMGEYAQAEDHFERAAQILGKAPAEPLKMATLYSNWSMLRHRMGDSAAALRLMNEALETFNKALPRNQPQRAMMLQNLAVVMDSLGETDRAEDALREALAITKDRLGEGDDLHTVILVNLGVHYQESGDLPRARTLLLRAVDQAQPGSQLWASARISLAAIELATGSFDAATRQDLESALRILAEVTHSTHPDYCYALSNLAVAQVAMSKPSESASTFHRSLDCLRNSLDLAATVQSERQQLAMLTKGRQVLDNFLSLSGQLFLPSEDLYGAVLLWKGVVLTRRLRLGGNEQDEELAGLRRHLQSVSSRLATLAYTPPPEDRRAAWRAEMARLSRHRENLQRNVARRSSTYRRQLSFQKVSPQQILDALPPDTVLIDLVEYEHAWLKGGGLLAFVLSRGRPIQRVDLGSSQAILALVETWRSFHGVGDRGVRPRSRAELTTLRTRIGRELRRRLWDPLAPAVGDPYMVLWSPDGASALVPPGALPGAGDKGFLLEEKLVVWMPTVQVLAFERTARGESVDAEAAESSLPGLLAVGAVDFDSSSFPDLPASGTEAQAVVKIFNDAHPGGPIISLEGKAASESIFRRLVAGRNFVHLATHGFFAPPELRQESRARDPGLQSGLVFASADKSAEDDADDGILTAVELETLDLSATEMLVLSACETGLGVSVAGEGLLGLLRAAQIAGARSVVASLWDVPDEQTSLLMKRFYQNLWEENMPRAEALRSAQLEVLRTDPNPSAWAGWILAGDWW